MKPLLAILLVVNVAFAALYLNERGKPPVITEKVVTVENRVEVPKEVPVERIVEKRVEVPIEVIKEVPREIPEEYEQAMAFRKQIAAAELVSDRKLLLRGIESVDLRIELGNKAKVLMDLEKLRTQVELSLRRNGVKIDPRSPHVLSCTINGLAETRRNGEELRTMIFSIGISVYGHGLLRNSDRWQMSLLEIWTTGSVGVVSFDDCQEYLSTSTASDLDKFCNEWLEVNPRR